MRQRHVLIGTVVITAGAIALWVWCRHATRNRQRRFDPELYYGNDVDHVVHLEGCPFLNLNDTIRVFASVDDALATGYRPCKSCYPIL